MTLRTQMTTDATTVFLREDDFAEPVAITYHPHRYFGEVLRADRTIEAVIERQQITVMDVDGDTLTPVWIVYVANSATTGISSDELDLGGDALTFSPREGEAVEKRSIVELISHDHAMLQLECR